MLVAAASMLLMSLHVHMPHDDPSLPLIARPRHVEPIHPHVHVLPTPSLRSVCVDLYMSSVLDVDGAAIGQSVSEADMGGGGE